MGQISIAKFHHFNKSILTATVCKLHISKEHLFEYRINLVDLPIRYFSNPLMVVCHQCGVFDLFMPISCYDEYIIGTFMLQVKKMFDFYMSKKERLLEYFPNIEEFGTNRSFFLIEERRIKIMAKRYFSTILFHDKQKEYFRLSKNIIDLVCLKINEYENELFQDLVIDNLSAGECYLIKSLNKIFGIGKRKSNRILNPKWKGLSFEHCLTLGKHLYYINLIYKRFGSFEPVTVSFRKTDNKIYLHFESYYNHGNIDNIVQRIKTIEKTITQWNSLITKRELQEFVEMYRHEYFSFEPEIMCQLLSRKYLEANHYKDDIFDSYYLSLCLLIYDVLRRINE
ncbi:MAG: hypothetical protein HDS01_05135 [Bacteroides sp.]|nr:hypothetical protein [Bacteroides sp.]